MKARMIPWLSLLVVLALCSTSFGMRPQRDSQVEVPAPLLKALGASLASEPFVLFSGGDTTWVEVHSSSFACPGDPNLGHGGEATGGPGPTQTWCFEEGPGDSCGTNPPWNTDCFRHVDVRALSSPMNINYWHVDTYRASQRAYCGTYALWCGSAALWEGQPVECGTWGNPPGYGDQWNCVVQLTLPPAFSVAKGCTVFFDPRYDTECKYDYFYIDYWNGTTWNTLASFNATSNNPGSTCGSTSANPDYWGNTDVSRLTNCNWQARTDANQPAFKAVIPHASLVITSNPKFRWRFSSDGAWSDGDGRGDTDGAAFIDNVWVWGDTEQYVEDFETGALDPTYWSLPSPTGVIDQWHISHDPDPPFEGGDGGTRTTCLLDSSYVYRGRPENGYPSGKAWRNGWYYRLMTPAIPIEQSGCGIQYDSYECTIDVTCDFANEVIRFYDSGYQSWCPWFHPWYYLYYNCFGPNYDRWVDLSSFFTATSESLQYAWELVDASQPSDVCRGKHTSTDLQVDNVSIGLFDADATKFTARGIDLLHDTFFIDFCAYNSFFDAYDPDTIDYYSGGVALPWEKQLVVTISDPDSVDEVGLVASIDEGATWVADPMVLRDQSEYSDEFSGDFSGTVCPADFSLTEWARGTEIWYYVKVTDPLANVEYWPATADPSHAGHTGGGGDYLEFSILPLAPDSTSASRVLLVDGYGRRNYDWSPCLSVTDRQVNLENLYGRTLADAGYCYDTYDVIGAGSSVHIDPIWLGDYDAVVWFTGPYLSQYLFDAEAQDAIRYYLSDGGKVVLCGDRIAYDMAALGEDSLGGEFLGGVMGCAYFEEMESALSMPHLYLDAVDTVSVFGTPLAVDLDSVLVYRGCPYLKDMSYVLTNESPPSGYTAQPLLEVLNPGWVASADGAIYTEYNNVGQCVYINFDLCGVINHTRGYCTGDAASPAPDFAAGTYEGRVDLMRVILEDIFGLPSGGGGQAYVPEPEVPLHQWALAQNTPNPWGGSTEIAFEVGSHARVTVRVFNVAGQLVRTLVDEPREPGRYGVSWDGRDRSGARVASGVYFYTMEAGSYKAARKMLVVK